VASIWQNLGSRALRSLLILFGVAIIVFVLFDIIPSDPARLMAGRHANSDQIALIRNELGLNQSKPIQFLHYINDLSPMSFESIESQMKHHWKRILTVPIGNYSFAVKWPYLGKSYVNGSLVSDIILGGFLETLTLALVSIFIALLLGIPIGVVSAKNPDGFWDKITRVLTTSGMAIPSFVLAICIGFVFGYLLSDYTGLSMTGSLFTYDVYSGEEILSLQHLVLPAITLAVHPFCVVTQLMRNSMVDVLQADYIRTARAKGLSKGKVLYKHALVNAISPVVTASATWLAALMAGSVFVEYVFGWNGLGHVIVNAIDYQDFPIIMGLTLFVSLIFVAMSGLLSMIYPLLDPTLRG
jgi:peptide/nickel transport system permease protein